MHQAVAEKSAIHSPSRRIVWGIIALAVTLTASSYWWWQPLKSWLSEVSRSDSSRAQEALAAYDRGQWERALNLARPLVKTRGNDPEVLRIYARASARLEHDQTAARIFQERLGAERMQPEDSLLLGLILVRAGQLHSARETWEKAAQGGPDHAELLDNLARLSVRLQRLDEAAAHARRLSEQPGWEARGFLLLGEIASLVDDPLAAEEAIRRGFAIDPAASGAFFSPRHYWKLLARSLLKLGRPAEALDPLVGTLPLLAERTKEVDEEAHWLESRAYLQLGRFGEAAQAAKLAGSYRAQNPLVPEPAPYAGAASCAGCHPRLFRTHTESRHWRTFHHGPGLFALPFPDHPLPDPDDPKATHAFSRDKSGTTVTTTAGAQVFKTVVEFAFGLRENYVTMIGRDENKTYRALRLSSYPTPGGAGWGRTAGDVPNTDSAENIRGEPISVRDGVVRCLYCHTTNYRDFRDPPPKPGPSAAAADAGVGCERCHGPGTHHIALAKAKTTFPDFAIINPGSEAVDIVNRLCSDCHIVGEPLEIKKAPEDPKWIRSVGVTMTLSRCYTQSGGGMSCLTCHDPHRDDPKTASFFEAKCLACHAPPAGAKAGAKLPEPGAAGAVPDATVKICPVNPAKGCLDCHMPKIPVPTLHMSLTDHFIRIRSDKR